MVEDVEMTPVNEAQLMSEEMDEMLLDEARQSELVTL